MAGLQFDPQDPSTFQNQGRSNTSLGANPVQPAPTSQPPMSQVAGDMIRQRANRGFLQTLLTPRSMRQEEMQTIGAAQTQASNEQTVQLQKLQSVGGVLKLLQGLGAYGDSLEPEQKAALGKIIGAPIAQLAQGMAGNEHETDHLTPELIESLMTTGQLKNFAKLYPVLGPDEHKIMSRAQASGQTPEQIAGLSNTLSGRILAPYTQMVERNLKPAADMVRQRLGKKPNEELSQDEFKRDLHDLLPKLVQSDPEMAKDPQQSLIRLAVATDQYLNDAKSAENLASAGIVPGSVALDRMKQTAQNNPTAVQRRRLVAEGYQEGTPEFDAELGKRMEKIVSVAPGGAAFRQSQLPGGNAPATAPASVQPLPLGQPAVQRAPTESDTAVKEQGSFNAYTENVGRLLQLLNDPEIKDMGRLDRAKYQALIHAQKVDPTGLLATQTPLPPKLADANYLMNQMVTEFEQHKGGMRAVSGPQIQGRMNMIHGGTIFNPNAPIGVKEIYNQLRNEVKARQTAATTGGRTPMPTPADTAPQGTAQPVQPPSANQVGKAPAPLKPTHRFNATTNRFEPVK